MEPKIVNILLTDIQLHVIKHRKPVSPARAIEKSLRNGRPGRFYCKGIAPAPAETSAFEFSIPLTEDMQKLKEKYEREGKTVHFLMPKEGIKLFLGKDSIDFIKAQKKKRVDRRKH